MSPRRTLATTGRVLTQLRHDHRTIGLLFVVPVLLMGLLAWIFENNPMVFDRLGPPLLGIFPFVMMFVVTSITMLRERSSGTLERLLTMPVARLDILLGYAGAFGIVAVVQAAIASVVSIYVFGLDVAGPEWFLVAIALADALLGMALGLLASAFARTEFQAVQFMPAFVLPQLLLCGLVVPAAQLPTVLRWASDIVPLTYAVRAMQAMVTEPSLAVHTVRDAGIIMAYTVAAVVLAAVTLRRQTR